MSIFASKESKHLGGKGWVGKRRKHLGRAQGTDHLGTHTRLWDTQDCGPALYLTVEGSRPDCRIGLSVSVLPTCCLRNNQSPFS